MVDPVTASKVMPRRRDGGPADAHPRRRGIRRTQWHRHPAVRSGDSLTVGERAADRLRNGMGSWGFVFAALVFIGGWMLGNRGGGFDKYPFILLNLILSCLAAMQGAILLIAARRSDQISSELATHDYATNVESERVVQAIHELTLEIHQHVCLAPPPARAPAP
jgi:uncharacterized membrane protein